MYLLAQVINCRQLQHLKVKWGLECSLICKSARQVTGWLWSADAVSYLSFYLNNGHLLTEGQFMSDTDSPVLVISVQASADKLLERCHSHPLIIAIAGRALRSSLKKCNGNVELEFRVWHQALQVDDNSQKNHESLISAAIGLSREQFGGQGRSPWEALSLFAPAIVAYYSDLYAYKVWLRQFMSLCILEFGVVSMAFLCHQLLLVL